MRFLSWLFCRSHTDADRRAEQLRRVAQYHNVAAMEFYAAGDDASGRANLRLADQALEARRRRA